MAGTNALRLLSVWRYTERALVLSIAPMFSGAIPSLLLASLSGGAFFRLHYATPRATCPTHPHAKLPPYSYSYAQKRQA